MQKMTVGLPTMYADHHVLRVRDALLSVKGVLSVAASAARREVSVNYDAGAITPEVIAQKLAAAGYAPDMVPPPATQLLHTDDRSAWYRMMQRMTRTESKDQEMSGDFRRY